MKRSKLCFGLLLALVTIFGLSLNVSSDVSALKHEYVGIPYYRTNIPSPSYDSDSGQKYLDWSANNFSGYYGSGLELKFEGDSHDSSYSSLSPRVSASYLSIVHSSTPNSCVISDYDYEPFPIFRFDSDDSVETQFQFDINSRLYPSISWPYSCRQDNHEIPNFVDSSIPAYPAMVTCNRDTGAVCNGLWSAPEYYISQILPYSYSSNGFYLKSKAIDSEGVHYSHTFSFNDMFNNYIPTFSFLSLPLHDTDGYFLDSSNLYSGRSLEFAGSFEFDGSFSWHSGIESNGSYFKFMTDAIPLSGSDITFDSIEVDCSTNLVTLDGLTRLDYSCPLTLSKDYLLFSNPRLEISGNGNYVWQTNDVWRFADVFVVTDHDDTLGDSFNGDITGGGTIIGDAQNDISDGSEDWFASLTSLFSFNLINPFAPIFNLFNNDSCAQIPTLASMLHSEEIEVCPWFDSTVRNITTPVLGLASMMLVFGFVVRWLGSRSGNFIEDSGGIDDSGFHFENKFRRSK